MPTKRRFPGVLLIGAFASIIGICFANILMPMVNGGPGRWTSTACRNSYQTMDMSDAWCAIDAVISYFSSVFAVCIWVCLPFTVVIKVMSLKISIRTQIIASYAFSTIIPLIGTIIMLSKRVISSSPTNGGICFVDGAVENGWYYIGLWIIPTGVMFILGTLAILVPLVYVIYVTRRHGKFSFFPLLELVAQQWRLLAFLGIYWYAVIISDSYYISIRRNQDEYISAAVDWYTCLYTTWGGLVLNGTSIATADTITMKICQIASKPNYNILAGITISTLTVIIVYPVLFLFDREIMRWFWEWIKTRKLPENSEDIPTEFPSGLSKSTSGL